MNREELLRVIEEATVDVACHLRLIQKHTYLGQIQPAPLGLGKQPTDCGRSCFGSHSTTSGNIIVNAMVMKNTT